MSSAASRAPGRTRNQLLGRLRAADRRVVEALAERVDLDFGLVLVEAGARLRHAWFPESGLVSLLAPPHPAGVLELSMIGREGMIGSSLVLGVATAPLQAVVQGRGSALRIPAAELQRQMAALPELRRLVAQHCHASFRAIAQSAPCGHYHVVEARLARWLLMTGDRVRPGSLHLTQAFLGRMLGARRVGVTLAAGALQRRGLIEYRRGEIQVLDRPGLEAAACACYQPPRRPGALPREPGAWPVCAGEQNHRRPRDKVADTHPSTTAGRSLK